MQPRQIRETLMPVRPRLTSSTGASGWEGGAIGDGPRTRTAPGRMSGATALHVPGRGAPGGGAADRAVEAPAGSIGEAVAVGVGGVEEQEGGVVLLQGLLGREVV